MNIKKIMLYILCGLIFLYGMEYLLKMLKHKENFELSTSSLSSSTSSLSTSSLPTSSLFGTSIPTYAYLAPITDTSRITNDTLDAVIKVMKSQNTDIDAMKDTTQLSTDLKQMTTEEEGQYYIKNKQFPIDPFVLSYIKYVTETEEYKTALKERKDSPFSKVVATWLDPIQTPNRIMFDALFGSFFQFFPNIKRINDNWQYPDTPSSPSEQLFSKDGYDIGGTVYKCDNPGLVMLVRYTNYGKPNQAGGTVRPSEYSILADEIPYFEFVDKEKPCNPCLIFGGQGDPPCQFKIAGSSPPLFQALWGIQPTSVDSEKNAPTNSFSGFDAATAIGSGSGTETKKEDPAVTASANNAEVAQNDADAKKAQLDVDSKKAEVDKQNADARKANAEATKAENEANKKPWF
jgi:hypothetical protein